MAHVLLIEPDAILATLYKKALERAGYAVSWQTTAQSAIHATDTVRPDVVLLELQLAEHNGLEFLYEFRSYPEWQDIPVIILSAVPLQDLQSAVLWEQLKIAAYHYKPTATLNKLIALVAVALTQPKVLALRKQ